MAERETNLVGWPAAVDPDSPAAPTAAPRAPPRAGPAGGFAKPRHAMSPDKA